MRKLLGIGVVALSLAFAGSALAADGASIFKSRCQACHGPEGSGGAIAPAFKGNDWIKSSAEADIAETIKNGRSGSAKRYSNFPMAMPPQSLSDAEVSAVIGYLKSLAGH